MIGHIIAAILLLIVLFVFYKVWTGCESGQGGIFPKICHWLF